MKLTRILTAVSVSVMLASCVEKPEEQPMQPITVTASFGEKLETKTAVKEGGKDMFWDGGDQIKFFYGDKSAQLKSSISSAASSASFNGYFPGAIKFGNDDIYGLYPYSEEATLEGSTITASIPSEQLAVAGSFAKDAAVAVARSGNMVMSFYNVCSGIRFTVNRSDIKSVTLEGNASEALAGKVKITFSGKYPTAKVVSGVQSITLSAPEGKCLQAGKWYYIVTAPVSLSKGFRLTLRTADRYAEKVVSTEVGQVRAYVNSFEAVDDGLMFIKDGETPGEGWESAAEAVQNFYVGWNLAGALESHGIACEYNYKKYPSDKVFAYETGWGYPKVTRELIQTFKDAGFKAIRFPVTWYPFMDDAGNVDEKYMARAQEIVDYIIDCGLYCILDTHHDAGSKDTRWLTAIPADYEKTSARFKFLWKQIATRFAGYGPKLIFQGYNEILDASCNWDNSDAASYAAANKLNQDFVDLVRSTGGNNLYRNLMVSVYAGSTSELSLKSFVLPNDSVQGHLMADVHSYAPYRFAYNQSDASQDEKEFLEYGATEINTRLKRVYDNLVQKGIPCILGEFGAVDKNNNYERAKQAYAYVATATKYNMPTFIWYGLMEKADRETLTWSSIDIRDAIFAARRGEAMPARTDAKEVCTENELAHAYMTNVTYKDGDYSYSSMSSYYNASGYTSPRRDHPLPVTLNWTCSKSLSSQSLTVTDGSNFTKTYSLQSSDRSLKVWNLVPGVTYSYTVSGTTSSGSETIASGRVRPTGQLRMIYAPSLYNVRDIGGWASSYKDSKGKALKVAYGRIFRGGEMDSGRSITEADKAVLLNDLGIGAEMDFRADADLPGITGSALGSSVTFNRYSTSSYSNASGNSSIAKDFSFIYEQVKAGKNVYMHCAGGADRTGTMAFVLEAVLGLSESDLSKEFELTSFYIWRSRIEGEKYDYATMLKTFKETYGGSTIQESCCNYLIHYGVTEQQLSDFRSLMLNN